MVQGVQDANDTLISHQETEYNSAGQVSASRVYNGGTSGSDYLETTYAYNSLGRRIKVTQPSATRPGAWPVVGSFSMAGCTWCGWIFPTGRLSIGQSWPPKSAWDAVAVAGKTAVLSLRHGELLCLSPADAEDN